MKNPKKIMLAQTEMVDNELCVYDPQQDEVHTLNPTAALVWEHCDGQTGPAELSNLLQREFNMPLDVSDELLWLILDYLGKANLLQEPMTGDRHIYTRRQVIKILMMAGLSAVLMPPALAIVMPSPVYGQTTTTTSTATSTTTSTSTATTTTTSTEPTTTTTSTSTATTTTTSTEPTTTTTSTEPTTTTTSTSTEPTTTTTSTSTEPTTTTTSTSTEPTTTTTSTSTATTTSTTTLPTTTTTTTPAYRLFMPLISKSD